MLNISQLQYTITSQWSVVQLLSSLYYYIQTHNVMLVIYYTKCKLSIIDERQTRTLQVLAYNTLVTSYI